MRLVGRLLESAAQPGVWPSVLIEAGASLNGIRYDTVVLKEAVEQGLFEGRPCMAFEAVDFTGRPIFDHLTESSLAGKTVGNVIGTFRNVRWNESAGRVEGDLHLLLADPVGKATHQKLVALQESNSLDCLGLSIDALGTLSHSFTGGAVATALHQITSIDLVTNPSAGGAIGHRLVASVTHGAHKMKFAALLKRLTESWPVLLGNYEGPPSEKHLETHIVRRVQESADIRAALVSALADCAKESREVALVVGDVEARLTEGVDVLGILDEVQMLLSIAREDLQQKAGAAIAADSAAADKAAADAGGTMPTAPAPAAPAAPAQPPASEPIQESRVSPTPPALSDDDRAIVDAARQVVEQARMRESEDLVRRVVSERGLPANIADGILSENPGKVFSRDQAERIVESRRKMVDEMLATVGMPPTVRVTESHVDKQVHVLAHMLNPRHCPAPEGHDPYMGSMLTFMERQFTGGRRIKESFSAGMNHRTLGLRRLKEAVNSTQFDQVFADALSRSTLAAYQGQANYDLWKKLVREVPYNDFRTHRIVHVGYYGNLPDVGKGGAYVAMTTPADREETIQLAKKGGIETIYFEDLLNDDISLWQTLIQRIGQAALETRYETVMKLIRKSTQPTMADGNELTDTVGNRAGDPNQVALPLSADATGKSNFVTMVTGMMQHTSGSGVKKGIQPKYCIIPFALAEAYAFVINALTGGNSGTDVAQTLLATVNASIPEAFVDLGATDVNDWFLMADPNDAEVIRFATLGNRDPEIFIADDERFGSMFTNDLLELKVRDIHAAAAVDYAGIRGSVN